MKRNNPIQDGETLPNCLDKELLYSENNWYIKLFELNSENSWVDKGTGTATIIRKVGFVKEYRTTFIIST